MQDIQSRLGVRIRQLRTKSGWSQEELADQSGLHRSYIGAIERGERNLSLANLYVLSRTLKISLAQLFRGVA